MSSFVFSIISEEINSWLANRELKKINNELVFGDPNQNVTCFQSNKAINVKRIAEQSKTSVIPQTIEELNESMWFRLNLTSGYNWVILELIETELIKNYDYYLAYQCRQLRNTILIYKFKTEGYYCFTTMWALIFNDMRDEAIFVANALLAIIKNPLNKDKLKLIVNLFIDNVFPLQKIKSIYNFNLENMKIKIYGPLLRHIDSAKDYKIVTIGNKGDFKCDISFYNGESSKKICKSKKTGMLNNNRYSAFFGFRYMFQVLQAIKGKAKKIYSVDFLFDFGQPNMLQNVLFHLLRNNPGVIEINGFNLYYSTVIYSTEYKANKVGIASVKDNFPVHNLISQFQFVKCLYNRGFFSCDYLLQDVLNLDICDYLRGMESICK